tara:strand:- start:27 stop:368 length:342 start_codon:yes stop_codon:yes gene_type:complete
MRKITQDAINALYDKRNFKRGNTEVKEVINYQSATSSMVMYLHGHGIAMLEDNNLYIRHAGWQTNTTKERLNGLPNVHINQKDFTWYLNGKKWIGGSEWTSLDCISLEDFSFN